MKALCPERRSTAGSRSGRSSASRPGPKSAAAAPCIQTAAAAAGKASMPWARSPRINAAENIPGSGGGQRRGCVAVDDGAAVGCCDDGVGAFQHDDGSAAARGLRARATICRPTASKMRSNSPSCGVMTQGPRMAWKSSSRHRREHTDGIGIEHDRLAGPQQVQRACTRRVIDACAGSNGKCRVSEVGKQAREISGLRQRLHHDAGERGGIDREGAVPARQSS